MYVSNIVPLKDIRLLDFCWRPSVSAVFTSKTMQKLETNIASYLVKGTFEGAVEDKNSSQFILQVQWNDSAGLYL